MFIAHRIPSTFQLQPGGDFIAVVLQYKAQILENGRLIAIAHQEKQV